MTESVHWFIGILDLPFTITTIFQGYVFSFLFYVLCVWVFVKLGWLTETLSLKLNTAENELSRDPSGRPDLLYIPRAISLLVLYSIPIIGPSTAEIQATEPQLIYRCRQKIRPDRSLLCILLNHVRPCLVGAYKFQALGIGFETVDLSMNDL